MIGEERKATEAPSRLPRETPLAEPLSPRKDLLAKIYYPALLLLSALSVWIKTGFPVHALVKSPHDDQLFIRLAGYLRAGSWLGPYDNRTLAKGMFYPLFIALSHRLSVPLKVAEQVAYLAASAAAAGLVRKLTGSHRMALVLFVGLAFNPVLWHVELARVLREGLYVSLSLAVVTLAVASAFPIHGQPSYSPLRQGLRGIGLGLIGAAFYLTREEGIWLAPALVVVIVAAILGAWQPIWVADVGAGVLTSRSARFKAIALPLLLALLVFAATDFLVATLNHRHYGIFETNEFRTKSFLRAYGAITRIREDEWHRYILFPKEARQRAYAVSPAARELASSLEGPLAEGWRQATCSSVGITPCPEVVSGWLMWELRDAVKNAGHYGSAQEAMNFYDTLADQINTACDDGRLRCLPRRATLFPPFRREYVEPTIRSSGVEVKEMFTFGGRKIGSAPSIGAPEGIAIFADTVGGVYPPEDLILSIRGWAAAVGEQPIVQLIGTDSSCQFATKSLPAGDIDASYPGLKAMRFELTSPGCPATGDIAVEVAGREDALIPLAKMDAGTMFKMQSSWTYTEAVSRGSSVNLLNTAQVKIASLIAFGYAIAFPVLTVLGAVGLVLGISLGGLRRFPIAILAFALASAAAVGTRIAMLAYIDATSFPATTVLYSSPASPFVIIFVAIGIYVGWATVSSRNRGRSAAGALKPTS